MVQCVLGFLVLRYLIRSAANYDVESACEEQLDQCFLASVALRKWFQPQTIRKR